MLDLSRDKESVTDGKGSSLAVDHDLPASPDDKVKLILVMKGLMVGAPWRKKDECDAALLIGLPLLDAFRTTDWVSLKQELGSLQLVV